MDDFFDVSGKIVSKIQPCLPALLDNGTTSVCGAGKAELTRPRKFRSSPICLAIKGSCSCKNPEHR